MQAREDALALLTNGSEQSTEMAMEHLLSMYGAQKNCAAVRDTFDPTQRKIILEELSDILHLRGHLQQMGATFSINGALLTYGNPYSPSEFQAMIRLGPMYEEQWSTFFIEDYVPPENGGADKHIWSELRTLKKVLRNEGVVFGREHQRYSFGKSSTKLRRLCCTYDQLRVDWLTMMRSSLPALDDAQLATLLERPSSGDESGFDKDVPESNEETVIINDKLSYDITARPRMPQYRSSGIPQAVGWRFSGDTTSSRRKNGNWRISDNLDSVPVWQDVERANVEKIQVVSQSVSITEHHDPKGASDMLDMTGTVFPPLLVSKRPLLHVSPLLANMKTQIMMLRDEPSTNPRGGNVVNKDANPVWTRDPTEDDKKIKKWGKVRRWFRHVFGRYR